MAVEGKTVLNLGAGKLIRGDAINHDQVKHSDKIDIVWDLNNLPWPWKDEQFELVIARAVLEHLDVDLLASMNEIWRVMKPGGKAFVKLPYWNHDRTWEDPTHRRGYAPKVFNFFDPSTKYGQLYGFYTPHKWKIIDGPTLNKAKTSILCTLEKVG